MKHQVSSSNHAVHQFQENDRKTVRLTFHQLRQQRNSSIDPCLSDRQRHQAFQHLGISPCRQP